MRGPDKAESSKRMERPDGKIVTEWEGKTRGQVWLGFVEKYRRAERLFEEDFRI